MTVEKFDGETTDITIDDYAEEIFKNSSMIFSNTRKIETSKIKIDNTEASRQIVSYTNSGETIKALVYCVVKDGYGYIFTCDSQPHNFDRYRKTFEDAVKSFRFE